MKTLKVIQSDTGRFNLLSDESQFVFSVGIFENGELVEKDDVKAILYYSGESQDSDDFQEPFENMDSIFTRCFDYGNRVISSTDYKEQCLLFFKEYKENFKEINEEYKREKREKLRKEKERIEFILAEDRSLYNVSDDMEERIFKDVEKYERWMKETENDMNDLKPESGSYKEKEERRDGYKKRAEHLRSFLK